MNKSFPKITIVTPNYNCAFFLETTIKSILDQNYPNLEYIIIDGGSTDGSIEIIKKYESQLAYWASEKDNGIYDAINKGFEKSTGSIMGWINSDDCHWPGSLHYLAETFSNNSHINWLQGIPCILDEDNNLIAKMEHAFSKYFFLTGHYKHNFYTIQQESTFWTRVLWERAGGALSNKYSLAGDFDLWIRYFQYEQLYCTDQQLGAFRIRTGQKSENLSKYIEEADDSIENNMSSFGMLVRSKVFIYKILNKLQFVLNNYLIRFRQSYLNRILGGKMIVK